jgi:hypothetical protein
VKGMITMRGYYAKLCDHYESLKTETNWLKLFIPTFITMTIFLVFIFPGIKYVIEVVIKNKEFTGSNFGYAIGVSLIYSAIVAGIESSANLKKKKKTNK